jgi:RNA polymerase sigma factor (sigma-70 family)
MKGRIKKVFDEWLVLSYRSGNKNALSVLVKKWNKKLIRHIYYKTHDLEVSKDIAQDCWIAIMRGVYSLNDPAEFGVWALRIANNKAVDWIRQQEKNRKIFDQKPIPIAFVPETIGKDERIEKIQRGYNEIDHKHRIMLNLYYRQGYSVKQMSKILKISEGTVKSRLFTARNELKKIINS